jgi:hypothetical protein
MKKFMSFTNKWVLTLLLAVLAAGCGSDNSSTPITQDPTLDSAKAISTYSLKDANGAITSGTIIEKDKTIAVTMPFATDMTALVATFDTSGSSVMVGTEVQTSGEAPGNDFTLPVDYLVTAADSTTATYTVTATAALADAKTITSFSVNGASGTINEQTGTILVPVTAGDDVTDLPATFATTGTSVMVGSVTQESGVTKNDFTNPVVYTVYDSNNNSVDYTVTLDLPIGPKTVNLGTAGDFAILAESAVSATGVTHVTGDIGLSPLAASNITGFDQSADSTNTFSTSALVTGKIYAANYTPPTPSKMTTAVADMHTAYTDAQTRVDPDFLNLYDGEIGGQTLVPGLYKYGTGLAISTDVTLSGGANDVWIIQVDKDLTVANGVIVTLSGGAQAKNIFWQVAGQTNLKTTADFKGIILCKTQIAFQTGAVFNGRALAQTQVTLDATTITEPAL